MFAIFTFGLGVIFGVAVVYFSTLETAPPQKPQPQVSLGEVTDLINRLKPLAEDPNSEWRGVAVKITGVSASVEIRMPDGNEYRGSGRTLPDAARMLDSDRIRHALDGWQPNK